VLIARQVIARARELKTGFGVKCSKFAGAVSVEILRAALASEGIPTSPRDVFVQGVPLEIDLVIPRPGEEPTLGVLYRAAQVAAALEVKTSGSFGDATIQKVRADFGRLREAHIKCAYVTLEERRGYRWALSSEDIGHPCFTLGWHRAAAGPFEVTEDWEKLLEFLRASIDEEHAS